MRWWAKAKWTRVHLEVDQDLLKWISKLLLAWTKVCKSVYTSAYLVCTNVENEACSILTDPVYPDRASTSVRKKPQDNLNIYQ